MFYLCSAGCDHGLVRGGREEDGLALLGFCLSVSRKHTHAHITHHKFLQLLPTAHGGIGRCPVKATRPPSNFNYLPFRSCVVQLRHFSPKSCKLTPIGASANFWMRFVFFPSRSNSNFRQSVLTNTPFGFVSSPSSLVGSDSLHQHHLHQHHLHCVNLICVVTIESS